MKKLLLVKSIAISIICLLSCSNEDVLQTLFPLNISVEEVLNDEAISSKTVRTYFASEQETKELLKDFYELDEDGYGTIYKEDNFRDVSNLENVTALMIKDYIKDAILYNKVSLFFKNNKLIQVYAEIENEEDVSLMKLKLANFPEPQERVFKQTSKWKYSLFGSDTTSFEFDVLQYKKRNVLFEIKDDKKQRTDDEIYYTYYTNKILPLCID